MLALHQVYQSLFAAPGFKEHFDRSLSDYLPQSLNLAMFQCVVLSALVFVADVTVTSTVMGIFSLLVWVLGTSILAMFFLENIYRHTNKGQFWTFGQAGSQLVLLLHFVSTIFAAIIF